MNNVIKVGTSYFGRKQLIENLISIHPNTGRTCKITMAFQFPNSSAPTITEFNVDVSAQDFAGIVNGIATLKDVLAHEKEQ